MSSRGKPCGVCARQSRARSTVRTIAPVVVDFLERVDDGQRRDRAVPARASAITRSIVAVADERARRVVHEHDAAPRQAGPPGRSRPTLAARRGRRPRRAGGRRRTGRARAADRRRSAAAARTTTIATSGRAMKVCTLCSSIGFPATQRNCLSSSPPDARAAAAGDDDDADVARRSRRASRRASRGRSARTGRAIVRTPTARKLTRGRACGTPRSARYAVVIPMFAASASRRSACDTGRISPPSPTSPRKTASCGSARSYTLDASAAATARSPAGSCSRTPPTTLRNTSSCANGEPGALVEHREQQREAARRRSRWPRAAACRSPPSRRAPAPRRAPGACLRAAP